MNDQTTEMRRRTLLKGGLAAAGASLMPMPAILSASPARAQGAWPARQITWLNPFPAGGGTDAFARRSPP